MKTLKKLCICALALIAVQSMAIGTASATLIDFDSGVPNFSPVPNGYGGLNWSNFYGLDTSVYEPSGYVNGVVSSNFVVYNAWGNPASFSNSSTFTFNSAYLTAAWNDGLQITVQGFVGGLGGTQLDSTTLTVNTSGPTLETFNWSGIDTVLFTSSGGTNHGYNGAGEHFAMDNVMINNPLPTPEPGGLTLLSLGFASIGGMGWLKRRRSAA
jgi:hypothetical protein